MTALMQGEGPLREVDDSIVRNLAHMILKKDPSAMEEFLASFPDRPLWKDSDKGLHQDVRSWNLDKTSKWMAVEPPPLSAVADAKQAEAAVPTPEEYPALRTALTLPSEEAAQAVAESLQAWMKVAGPAPLQWAFAHLTPESAGRMLDEVIPVWAQHDAAGLRAWYATGPNPDWWPADPDYCLAERIISALAAQDPVAATDFLLNQCSKTFSVRARGGSGWSTMSGFQGDIAAGLTSPDQCREVLFLLDECRDGRERTQEITLLKSATFARWKLWDAPAAQEWEAAQVQH
jgi:hypothetical protein